MAGFSFNNFNKERLFTFDTNAISGCYKNLEALYRENGEDAVYQIKGVYISTKSEFTEESPIIAIEDTYVNLPQHQLADVKSMLETPAAIRGINEGYAGFEIRKYTKNVKTKKKNGTIVFEPKDCYSAVWCDYEPDIDDEQNK